MGGYKTEELEHIMSLKQQQNEHTVIETLNTSKTPQDNIKRELYFNHGTRRKQWPVKNHNSFLVKKSAS
jgi:hypothetical protein